VTEALELLRCHACGAAVPLRAAEHTTCPYCHASVQVPARYRHVLHERAQEAAVRRELEHQYSSAAHPPARWIDVLAIALVLALPALAAGSWMAVASRAAASINLFTFAIVPAMLPGTALWLWSAAVHATIVRFQTALSCHAPERPDGPSCCRICGAPLDVPADALATRCPYCGSDNLVADITPLEHRIEDALANDLRTLDTAAAALRLRRRLLVGGSVLAVTLFTVIVWAMHFIYGNTWDAP
jgi:DNA-directed RNA polymerase subunit RPC12/RpoP